MIPHTPERASRGSQQPGPAAGRVLPHSSPLSKGCRRGGGWRDRERVPAVVQSVVFSLRSDSLTSTEPLDGASERIVSHGWSFLSEGETAGWFQLRLWRCPNKDIITCSKMQFFVVSPVPKHRAEGNLLRNRFLAGEKDGGSRSKPSGNRIVQSLAWGGYVSPGLSGNHTIEHSLSYLAMYFMPGTVHWVRDPTPRPWNMEGQEWVL